MWENFFISMLFFLCAVALLKEASASNRTGFIDVMILSSSEGIDPWHLWVDTGSPFNNADNVTLSQFLAGTSPGYRNTMINDWQAIAPDLVRVCYLDNEGKRFACTKFSVTGSTLYNWHSSNRVSSCSNCNTLCSTDSGTFPSYSTSFTCFDNSSNIYHYHSTSLKLDDGSVYFIVATSSNPSILPAEEVDDTTTCRLSFNGSHPFMYNSIVYNQYSDACSAICRERGYPYGAKQPGRCSCLGSAPDTLELTTCNFSCAGNNAQLCGSETPPAAYPSDSVLFNYVFTNIDPTLFNGPSMVAIYANMTSFIQISFNDRRFLTGYDVFVVDALSYPVELSIDVRIYTDDCSSADLLNYTPNVQTVTINNSTHVVSITFGRVSIALCAHVHISGVGVQYLPITSFNLKAIQANRFVTADYISVEIAWEIPTTTTPTTSTTTPTTTTTTSTTATTTTATTTTTTTTTATPSAEDTCECDCWVYNLLYGDSPYDNLTYEEIEEALYNVTEQIRRELTVNTSELSSTIRKKISADDDRASAIVVGYALGVALLTVTFGGIIMMDVTRLHSSLVSMKDNVMSRFKSGPTYPRPSAGNGAGNSAGNNASNNADNRGNISSGNNA